jgi:hypothetical protein
MRKYFGTFAAMVMLAASIIACREDFNEEAFIREQKKAQEEEAQKKLAGDSAAVRSFIESANEAGDLLSVTILVLENGNPLSGVSVSITTGDKQVLASGRAKEGTTVEGITNEEGRIVFDKVVIGAGVMSFRKSGYVTATSLVDFGTPDPPREIKVGEVIQYVTPPKRFESATVPMFSASPASGSTATIKGRVTIESDVTNTTSEVPQDLTIRANFSSLVTNADGFIQSYTLADDATLGKATIAADGTYTMVVPALAAGSQIGLIIPNSHSSSLRAVDCPTIL